MGVSAGSGTSMAEEITDEFANAELKDLRRNRRLDKVVTALAKTPAASISAASGGWGETLAAYRLLHCSAVTSSALIAPHQEAVVQRCAQYECVVVAQDTTELDFTHMKEMEGLGPLNDEKRRGFYMHGLYAISEGGVPLGLLDADINIRKDEHFRINAKRKKRPIEEKESYRWVEGYRKTQELALKLPECEVISISDREGDIYEVFEAWQKLDGDGPRAEWLIRANQDRALLGIEDGESSKLFEALENSAVLGEIEFDIRAKKLRTTKKKGNTKASPRSARTVRQTIRAMKITPRPPHRPGKKIAAVSFWAVLAEEIDPPEGEDPVRWVLLTSKEAGTFEEACRILTLYLRRWDIEVFHRVLKTGCRVEQIQLKKAESVIKALMIYSVISWRILYLTHLGRYYPELPCGSVFEEAEWKATCAVVKRKKEAGEPTLGEFILIVGKLGGHLGRKSDGPPGPQSIWQGMTRIRDFACAWHAIHGK
jgi:hypothetical protein